MEETPCTRAWHSQILWLGYLRIMSLPEDRPGIEVGNRRESPVTPAVVFPGKVVKLPTWVFPLQANSFPYQHYPRALESQMEKMSISSLDGMAMWRTIPQDRSCGRNARVPTMASHACLRFLAPGRGTKSRARSTLKSIECSLELESDRESNEDIQNCGNCR